MTNEVKLKYAAKGIEVDLTNLGVTVNHVYNNPLILVPTPVTASPAGWTSASPALGLNMKCINIGFVANRIILKFTLTDGIGSMNFGGSGATNYEKIVYISNNSSIINPKTLTINGHDENAHVESFNISFAGGSKDLSLGATVSLILTDSIQMVD